MTYQFRNRATGAYPVTPTDIRTAHKANVSFGPTITPEVADALGYDTVQVDAEPSYDAATQSLVSIDPQFVAGVWVQGWLVTPLAADVIAQKQAAVMQATVAAFDAALTAHLDSTAQAKRYDNRISCAVRAGYAGPFQAEGATFAVWMDACNALAYSMLAAVQTGTEPMPASPAAFIATLPAMVWPT